MRSARTRWQRVERNAKRWRQSHADGAAPPLARWLTARQIWQNAFYGGAAVRWFSGARQARHAPFTGEGAMALPRDSVASRYAARNAMPPPAALARRCRF